jgi:hypothetical protein
MTGPEIIELTKALAWPCVTVFAILYLRVQLRAAFARLTEIGPTGAKFAPPAQQQVPAPSSPTLGKEDTSQVGAAKPISVQTFISQLKSGIPENVLEPMVGRIRQDLVAIAGDHPSDQIEALVYNLASTNVQLSYERIYNAIFGSQLSLLLEAGGFGGVIPTPEGVSQALARQRFDQAKTANSTWYGTFSFEAWIGFLVSQGLLTMDANGRYFLTDYGRGFLRYVFGRQLSLVKLG